jgi:hypothetical protein
MSKVLLGMSVSLDGIAGGAEANEDGYALHEAILGWVFPLRSWREAQGQEGGEGSVDSRIWGADFERFGPQVIGRRCSTSAIRTGATTRRSTHRSSS